MSVVMYEAARAGFAWSAQYGRGRTIGLLNEAGTNTTSTRHRPATLSSEGPCASNHRTENLDMQSRQESSVAYLVV